MAGKKIDRTERDERIYELRAGGASFAEIARQFGISREGARRIFLRMREQKELHPTWPPLRKMLSNRICKALHLHFNDDRILEDPRKIADAGRDRVRRIKNIGEKSVRELADALRALGCIGDEDAWR